jgi:molybdopterin-guanine dinucleotide biosynthesis protein A
MGVTGFVLAGGASRRMGRDKALLEYQGRPAAAVLAARLSEATGEVTLIGDPERYAHLGFPVVGDRVPGLGPMGGLATALGLQAADWNLVIACDFLHVTSDLLKELAARALASPDLDCVAAALPGSEPGAGPQPLCAAYHARLAGHVTRCLQSKHLKMKDFLAEIRTGTVAVRDPAVLANLNTPGDWARHGLSVEPLRRVSTRS